MAVKVPRKPALACRSPESMARAAGLNLKPERLLEISKEVKNAARGEPDSVLPALKAASMRNGHSIRPENTVPAGKYASLLASKKKP